jgi:hypothetical protein
MFTKQIVRLLSRNPQAAPTLRKSQAGAAPMATSAASPLAASALDFDRNLDCPAARSSGCTKHPWRAGRGAIDSNHNSQCHSEPPNEMNARPRLRCARRAMSQRRATVKLSLRQRSRALSSTTGDRLEIGHFSFAAHRLFPPPGSLRKRNIPNAPESRKQKLRTILRRAEVSASIRESPSLPFRQAEHTDRARWGRDPERR